MKILKRTIPTNFIKLDTNISAADQYANVRDIQVAKENHNILIARGLHKNVCYGDLTPSAAVRSATTAYGYPWFANSTIGHNSKRHLACMVDCLVYLEPNVQTCTFTVNATAIPEQEGTSGGDLYLYPVLSQNFLRREIMMTNKITIPAGSAEAQYTCTVPVPDADLSDGRGFKRFFFNVYAAATLGDEVVASQSTDAVGPNNEYIQTTTAKAGSPLAALYGGVIYFDDATIGQRTIIQIVQSGLTVYLYVDRPWDVNPPTAADNHSVTVAGAALVGSFNLFEDTITDFGSSGGVI